MQSNIVQKIKTAGYVTVTSAAILGGIVGLFYLRIRLEESSRAEARQKYAHLEKLADMDGNGQLSDIEKRLMAAYLNENRGRTEVEWYDWLPPEAMDPNRINHAIEKYEPERR